MASCIIYEFNTKQKGFGIDLEPCFTQHIVWSFICVSYLMNTAEEENYVEQFSSYSSNFHPYSHSLGTHSSQQNVDWTPCDMFLYLTKIKDTSAVIGIVYPSFLNFFVHEEIVPHFLHIICCKTWKWTWTDIRVHMKEVVSCYYTFILYITAIEQGH